MSPDDRAAIADLCRLDSWQALAPWLSAVWPDAAPTPQAVVDWLADAPTRAGPLPALMLQVMAAQPWSVHHAPADHRLSLRLKAGADQWQLHLHPCDTAELHSVHKLAEVA